MLNSHLNLVKYVVSIYYDNILFSFLFLHLTVYFLLYSNLSCIRPSTYCDVSSIYIKEVYNFHVIERAHNILS